MNGSASRALKWWRLVAPGRDSVARTSDRLQAALALTTILLALAAIPFSAAAGSQVYAVQKQQSVRELAEDRQATATLLADGPLPTAGGRGGEGAVPAPTAAEWFGPDGRLHAGQVSAGEGMHRGDTVAIWVNRSGGVVSPPLRAPAVVVNSVAAAIGLFLATCVALALAYAIAVFALNRRRAGKWQQEWYAELAKKARS
ncbi:hypothetical protein VSH64_08715 [Amycolatopsis rhabdoformis]|uniref:Transmembrane protein n=1 Tax=Amycolatopsis rhabdoformis TaxID=1448059 RepID=A0ABZ1ICJ2_9PSEU|nr:hypothetical protein [Amycolatopsis rhabdoformis]WSE32189.1 hypothetical protein VSH64_08715 [Amycolatopsis rhabdoformis]